jgi:allantoicase
MTPAFLELIDLAGARLGGAVVSANDEFFAPKENLVRSTTPVWREGDYTERGKWMDGWETRRRREPGHDWCIVRLGAPGVVRGVDVDTAYFKGNFPEACAIDVCERDMQSSAADLERASWREVLARTPLAGDSHNYLAIADAHRATHLRLRIFPDGGVARLRVYGDVAADWTRLRARGEVDLAAAVHGGLVIACSDMFFGSRHNLIMPGDARNMGDGWETKRRRGPGHDWTIVRLAARGRIQRVEIDTRHFKGNAPGAFSLEACVSSAAGTPEDGAAWRDLIQKTPLQPDARHVFELEAEAGEATHVRLNIFPDGGVARLRLFGVPVTR